MFAIVSFHQLAGSQILIVQYPSGFLWFDDDDLMKQENPFIFYGDRDFFETEAAALEDAKALYR